MPFLLLVIVFYPAFSSINTFCLYFVHSEGQSPAHSISLQTQMCFQIQYYLVKCRFLNFHWKSSVVQTDCQLLLSNWSLFQVECLVGFMSTGLNCNTVSQDNSLTDLHVDVPLIVCVSLCVFVYDSGEVAGPGKWQSGWSDGQCPGRRRRCWRRRRWWRRRRRGACVFASSGWDVRRFWQSPDARQ